ncbi:MAG: cyanophycinase [Limnohabitans sp.]
MPSFFTLFTSPLRTLLVLTWAWMASTAAFAGKSYSYFYMGDPSAATAVTSPAPNTQSVVLVGGGYDVAEAFRWMIKRSGVLPATNCSLSGCTPTTGGRFLILRATGTAAYNPYILSRLGTPDTTGPYENVGGVDMGLTSVETLIVPSITAANDSFVEQRIKAAHAIWIAGGNQADYVNYWQNTKLSAALNAAIKSGKPIGGTSAGTAVLGQYAFAALNGSVTSSQALLDPYNKYMTFDPTLPTTASSTSLLTVAPLANTMTDDHLDSRDRMGRMVAFLSRITKQTCSGGAADIAKSRAIGLDEETALVISYSALPAPVATAQLLSNPVYSKNINLPDPNSAYMLEFSPKSNLSPYCQSGKPLQITGTPSVFTMVRTTANDVGATTTACSTTSQLLSQCTSLYPIKVSYTSANISFNLSNWTSSCTNSSPTLNGQLACSTTTMYPSNGYLIGTTY